MGKRPLTCQPILLASANTKFSAAAPISRVLSKARSTFCARDRLKKASRLWSPLSSGMRRARPRLAFCGWPSRVPWRVSYRVSRSGRWPLMKKVSLRAWAGSHLPSAWYIKRLPSLRSFSRNRSWLSAITALALQASLPL
ncbi:hypothetical protein D3C72_1570300 [compost metagenome]